MDNELDEVKVEEAPKVEKLSLDDINQAKEDDLVARIMEQILKIQ